MSTMSIRLSSALVALVVLLLTPASVFAEDGAAAKIVQSCVERVQAVTVHSVDASHDRAGATIGSIAQLDGNGAPPQVLIHTANAGRASIVAITQLHKARLDATTAGCITRLQDVDAPPAAFMAVINANRLGTARITAASVHSREVVQHALANALNN